MINGMRARSSRIRRHAWAIRGSDEVQIQMRGNEKPSYTVMVAVTVDGLKLPLFTIVRGKIVRSEWGPDLDSGHLNGPAHTATGRPTTETMQQLLKFLSSLPEYAGMHEVHVIVDCHQPIFATMSGRWRTCSASAFTSSIPD
jgi:hypothetical protein